MRIARELFSELAQLVGMTTRLSNDTRRAEDPSGPILAADSGVDRAYVSRTSALSLTRRLMSSSGWRLRQRSRLPSCLLFPSPMSSVPSHFPEAEEHKASGANPDPNRARRPGYQLLLLRAGRPCFSRAADPAAASCAPTASMTFNAPAGSAATGTG